MQCTCNINLECDNPDLKRCEKCEGNMLCMCTRKEVVQFRKNLWRKIK